MGGIRPDSHPARIPLSRMTLKTYFITASVTISHAMIVRY